MAIHVNIGEAKTRLSELVAAAVRGEEVVVARAGEPQVRLVPVAAASEAAVAALRAKRLAALAEWRAAYDGREIDVKSMKMTDAEWDERDRMRFGDLT